MIPENEWKAEEEAEECIVCNKPVRHGTGFAHIKCDKKIATLCCPLCMETFQRKPELYLRRIEMQRLAQSLHSKPVS